MGKADCTQISNSVSIHWSSDYTINYSKTTTYISLETNEKENELDLFVLRRKTIHYVDLAKETLQKSGGMSIFVLVQVKPNMILN